MREEAASIILAMIFLTFGCQSNQPKPSSIPEIEIEENTARVIRLRELFNASDLIKLEYSPESVVGNVDLLRYHNGKIYIASPPEGIEQRDLVIFDANGSFITRIAANGEGLGSIFSTTDFFIARTGHLEILDRNRRRITRYAPDGSFMENIPIPCEGIRFLSLHNQDHVIYRGFAYEFTEPKGIPYNLARNNANGECKFLHTLWMHPVFRDRAMDAGDFFFPNPNDNGWFICDVFNDTIFSLDSDGRIEPAFKLKTPDLGKKSDFINKLIEVKNRNSDTDFNLRLLELLNDPTIIKKPDLIMGLPAKEVLVSYRRESKRYFATIDLANETAETFTMESNLLDNWFVFQYDTDKFAIVINSPIDLSRQLSTMPENLAALPVNLRESLQKIDTDVNPYLLVVKPDALFQN